VFLIGSFPNSLMCLAVSSHRGELFLISNFRGVLNVLCFLLGDSPESLV
jgi:hypothetical protein